MVIFRCDLKSHKEEGIEMTNTVCMEAALARVGKTKGECAEALGISCRSLHKKVANITEFKASEIEKLIELLELNDEKFRMIFFT